MLSLESMSTESITFTDRPTPAQTCANAFFEGFNQQLQQNMAREREYQYYLAEQRAQSELRIREREAIMNLERQQRIEDENRYRNRNEKVDQILSDVERISSTWHQ